MVHKCHDGAVSSEVGAKVDFHGRSFDSTAVNMAMATRVSVSCRPRCGLCYTSRVNSSNESKTRE